MRIIFLGKETLFNDCHSITVNDAVLYIVGNLQVKHGNGEKLKHVFYINIFNQYFLIDYCITLYYSECMYY